MPLVYQDQYVSLHDPTSAGAFPQERKPSYGPGNHGHAPRFFFLPGQISAQGEAFEQTGGFSERLTAWRIEAREQKLNAEPSPKGPQCGQPMRRRKSAKGEFWGCAGFPECLS